MASVTFLPVAPWPLLLLLVAVGLVLVWWPPAPSEARSEPVGQLRRSAAVVLLLLAALRPGVPGGSVTATATDLDVFFVVDTTSSMMAEDHDGARPRLGGVRADVEAIASGLAGARYSLLTFDHETVTRLPLTTDSQALTTAMDVLQVETSTYSQGSSITVAAPDLDAALERDRTAHPDRPRLVFYLGDGEQTAPGQPAPFELDKDLVSGGAVLGYGTSRGGPMKETGTRRDAYIVDPATGQPALSTIGEKALQDIAQQLSVPYLHRTAATDPPVLDSVRATQLAFSPGASSSGAGRDDLAWVALLLLAAVVAWELAATLAAVRLRDSVRSSGPPRPPDAPAPPTGATTGLDPTHLPTGGQR